MKRFSTFAALTAAVVLAMSLCASAGSTDNFSGPLTGVSGTVSGSFTFNSSNDSFSNIKLSFGGSTFGGVNASDPNGGQGVCVRGLCGFWWQTQVGSNWIADAIIVNLATGQYQDVGSISDWRNRGGFNYLSMPEGSSTLAYLLMSAVAVFGGLLMSGKRRYAAKSI